MKRKRVKGFRVQDFGFLFGNRGVRFRCLGLRGVEFQDYGVAS